MSFSDKLNEAVNQVLREYDLSYLKLENEINIHDLSDQVPIELVIDSGPESADSLSGPKSVNLLIDLPSIIATGEDITVETFKEEIITQLEYLRIIPRHIFVVALAHPVLSEDGRTVMFGVQDKSGERISLELSTDAVKFIVGELQKLLTPADASPSPPDEGKQ